MVSNDVLSYKIHLSRQIKTKTSIFSNNVNLYEPSSMGRVRLELSQGYVGTNWKPQGLDWLGVRSSLQYDSKEG